MRSVMIPGIVFLLVTTPALATAQQPVSSEAEIAAYRELAAAIPLGSRVKVQTRQGRSLTATLMSVTPTGLVIKREGRLPEPAVEIPFSELARLQRAERGGGVNIAKAIGIGIAAGAGALLAMLAFAYTVAD